MNPGYTHILPTPCGNTCTACVRSIIVAAEAVLRVEIVRDELQEWEVEVSVLESQLPDVWYQGRKKYQYKVVSSSRSASDHVQHWCAD